MNPDVVSAIALLRRDNVLGNAQATLFDRVARRRLVSVRFEIRALLYAGVLLLTSGVALLVKEHRQDIGPWAIAGGIALAAAACLVWIYFAQGVVAVYVGLLRLLFERFRYHVTGLPFFLAALLGLGVLVLILAAHRRMRER